MEIRENLALMRAIIYMSIYMYDENIKKHENFKD